MTDHHGTAGLRQIAERYVDIVNRGAYGGLAALFAEDAVFLGPGGRVFHGRAEIGEFYGAFLPTIRPQVRLASVVEQGHQCVWELEARTLDDDEYRLGAIDHATFDADGLITRFAVYTK